MQRPWMPMYWGDFLRDTRHLSKWQRDSYMMLIAHYWTTGALPDDDRQLANITDCTLKEWRADKAVVQAFFYDGWKHKRLDHELARHLRVRTARAAAGSKGGTIASMNRFKNKYR